DHPALPLQVPTSLNCGPVGLLEEHALPIRRPTLVRTEGRSRRTKRTGASRTRQPNSGPAPCVNVLVEYENRLKIVLFASRHKYGTRYDRGDARRPTEATSGAGARRGDPPDSGRVVP